MKYMKNWRNILDSKIKSYLGLCRKANYLIIGSDKLKHYSKKLYLVVVNLVTSKNIEKIMCKFAEAGLPIIATNEDLGSLINIPKCQIVGIKNKGLSDAILNCTEDYKNIRGEDIGKEKHK